jgi:hypothetical protein
MGSDSVVMQMYKTLLYAGTTRHKKVLFKEKFLSILCIIICNINNRKEIIMNLESKNLSSKWSTSRKRPFSEVVTLEEIRTAYWDEGLSIVQKR